MKKEGTEVDPAWGLPSTFDWMNHRIDLTSRNCFAREKATDDAARILARRTDDDLNHMLLRSGSLRIPTRGCERG